MALLTEVVEGWTKRLTFTLLTDGAAFDGTGMTLSDLYLTNGRGETITTAGNFGWVSQAAGTVYYDPDAADLVGGVSPYTVRFKVTDGSGKVVMFPNAAPDTIIVHKVRR